MTGAEHGAATRPDAEPITNAPGTLPPPPAPAARLSSRDGILTGTTSSIASAARIRRFAIPKYSHGLVLTAPNIVPVIPANRPSAAYTAARPSTYANVSNTVRERGRRAPPTATASPPTIAAVIGIIG